MPFADNVEKILGTSSGYGIVWFIVLYFIGAYIHLHGINLFKKNIFNLMGYFIVAIGMVVSKLLMIFLSQKYIVFATGQNYYFHYDAISVLLESVFLFVFFKRLNVKSQIISKIVTFLVPSIFSVYLIHQNFQWTNLLWNDWLKANQFVNSNYFLLHYMGCVLLVFVSCIMIDQIRRGLFYLFNKMIMSLKSKHHNNDCIS